MNLKGIVSFGVMAGLLGCGSVKPADNFSVDSQSTAVVEAVDEWNITYDSSLEAGVNRNNTVVMGCASVPTSLETSMSRYISTGNAPLGAASMYVRRNRNEYTIGREIGEYRSREGNRVTECAIFSIEKVD